MIEFEQLVYADLVTAEWSILIGKNVMYVARADLDKETWDSGYTLLSCTRSEKIFSDSSLYRVLLDADKSRLATIYAKQSASVARPVSFGGLSWAKVASGSSSSLFGQVILVNSGSSSEIKPFLLVVTKINDRFAAIEHSLASLTKHVNILAKKLETPEPMNQEVDIVMSKDLGVVAGGGTVVGAVVFDTSVIEKMEDTLKNLAITVMGLSAKIDNASLGICVFISGLDSGYLGSGIAVVMNDSLTRHVYKISEADEINSLMTRTVNKSSFVILGSNFNKDGSRKYASFKKCLNLELINFLVRSLAVWAPTWSNSYKVTKVIDYVLVSANLVGALIHHGVLEAVSVSVSLGRLLNTQLNFFCKKVNMDYWKYDIKSADKVKWCEFKVLIAANAIMFSNKFISSVVSSDLNSIIFTKGSSKFYKLEILVSRIVKASHRQDSLRFTFLMSHWASLDSNKALVVQVFLDSGVNYNCVKSALFGIQKSYCAFKLAESLRAQKSNIRSTIDRHMESFAFDKSHTIRSVLKRPFYKVKLDHLVVGNKLILELELVKVKVDVIMEGWTRKCKVVSDIFSKWSCQYQPLEHVFNGAFSDVMQPIDFDKLFGMVSDLPDGKAAGLFSIPNKLWKHCDKSFLGMLLEFLNTCLISKSVPSFWKEAWVLMIPKSYKWKDILINTYPIALIETAHKILSKILFDRISMACSSFDVFHGNNFSVLKDTSTQSSIFAVSLVIEDALKKNHEL
ncbi:hypothetical protein G9A89_007317 [Geosiphon pyriformis]|nr:hypothetical protein G9A89_007317 [Geosiphon pyriformis]